MPMLLPLANIIISNTNTCRIILQALEVPVVTLPFRHPSTCHLRRRDLVVVSRYQRQRPLALSMGFKRRLPSGQWFTRMAEWNGAAAARAAVQWADQGRLSVLEMIVIGDISIRVGGRKDGRTKGEGEAHAGASDAVLFLNFLLRFSLVCCCWTSTPIQTLSSTL